MEIGVPEIDNSLAFRIPDVGVLDIPFIRDGPVEDLSSSWHFMNSQRDEGADFPERLTHSIPSNAPADRIEIVN